VELLGLVERDHGDLLELVSGAIATLERGRRDRRQADRLVAAATRHLAAEEQYLWPAVRDALPGSPSLVVDGRRRSAVTRRLLRSLDRRDAYGDAGDAALRTLAADLEDHVRWQRQRVLTDLAGALDPPDNASAGRRYATALTHAPTRPHRLALVNPAALKTLGAAAARVDRVRDPLTGRAR
jgi:hypothetical protein